MNIPRPQSALRITNQSQHRARESQLSLRCVCVRDLSPSLSPSLSISLSLSLSHTHTLSLSLSTSAFCVCARKLPGLWISARMRLRRCATSGSNRSLYLCVCLFCRETLIRAFRRESVHAKVGRIRTNSVQGKTKLGELGQNWILLLYCGRARTHTQTSYKTARPQRQPQQRSAA